MNPETERLRLFVAALLPEETRELLASFVGKVKDLFPGYRFVAPENWHITLQFLGEVPSSSVEDIVEALSRASRAKEAFKVSFCEAGAFPERGMPRILHIAATGGREPLSDLARDVRSSLFALGYGDSKPFAPHITLARERRGTPPNARGYQRTGHRTADVRSAWKDCFDRFLKEEGSKPEWEVKDLVLMRSILRPEGAQYTPLAAIDLPGTEVRSLSNTRTHSL